MARTAAGMVGYAGSVSGADVSADMLEVAASLPLPAGARVPVAWQQADAGALPYADESFDVLVCQQGFQFFPDKAAAAREMRRVLAPGGRALLSCWRDLPRQGLFPVLIDAAWEHVGGDAVAMIRSAFDLDVEAAREMLLAAGFRSVRAGIRVSSARFARVDTPAEMIALLLTAAPPVLAAINGAPKPARAAVETAVGAAMAGMRDDDGIVFPIQTHLLTAQA